MKTWSPKVQSEALVLGINNVIRDALASITRAELCKVLANHGQVERHEHWFRERDLEPNLEP